MPTHFCRITQELSTQRSLSDLKGVNSYPWERFKCKREKIHHLLEAEILLKNILVLGIWSWVNIYFALFISSLFTFFTYIHTYIQYFQSPYYLFLLYTLNSINFFFHMRKVGPREEKSKTMANFDNMRLQSGMLRI